MKKSFIKKQWIQKSLIAFILGISLSSSFVACGKSEQVEEETLFEEEDLGAVEDVLGPDSVVAEGSMMEENAGDEISDGSDGIEPDVTSENLEGEVSENAVELTEGEPVENIPESNFVLPEPEESVKVNVTGPANISVYNIAGYDFTSIIVTFDGDEANSKELVSGKLKDGSSLVWTLEDADAFRERLPMKMTIKAATKGNIFAEFSEVTVLSLDDISILLMRENGEYITVIQ